MDKTKTDIELNERSEMQSIYCKYNAVEQYALILSIQEIVDTKKDKKVISLTKAFIQRHWPIDNVSAPNKTLLWHGYSRRFNIVLAMLTASLTKILLNKGGHCVRVNKS